MTTALPKLVNYQLISHQSSINCLALGSFATEHHHTIASGGNDNVVHLWDSRTPFTDSAPSRTNSSPIDSISTKSPATSIVFGELSLPFTSEQPARAQISTPSDPTSPSNLVMSKDLFETNANALFCATDNIIYQYDLRKMTNSSPLSQHIAISNEFDESIGFLTLSPDGKQIAICTDDNTVHFVSLNSLPLTTSSALQQQIHQHTPYISLNKHQNMPSGIMFDPYAPIRLISSSLQDSSPYFQSFTAYSTGMDMNIIQYGLPSNVEPFRTTIAHQYTQQSSTNVNENSMAGQVSNPPFIYASTISPNSSTLLSALGDGHFTVHALEREALLPTDILSTLTQSAKEYQSASTQPQYLQYIDALSSLYTSTRSYTPFKSHPPTYLGRYRGHMHAVVGITIPSFLQSSIDSTFTSRLWLSNLSQQTLYRNYASQLPPGSVKKPSFFSILSPPSNDFYAPTEQETISSVLRHIISQQYSSEHGSCIGKAHGKPLYEWNRQFDDIRHILTCSLDQTLVLWKPSIADESAMVYNVSRSKSYQPRSTNDSNNNKKTKGQKVKQQSTLQPEHKTNYKKVLESINSLDDATAMEIQSQIEHLTQVENEINFYNQIEDYESHLVSSYRKTQGTLDTNLIFGMYKKLPDHEILESDLIQLRIPLPSKPNAMVTDRIGNVYIADTTNKVTVVRLIKE